MSDFISATHNGNCIPVTTSDELSFDSVKLPEDVRDAIQSVEDSIEELNTALRRAMEAGATVELRRRGRVHSGDGCWADQMATLVLPKSEH
ncbi:MAG TPA: hypothetical protein VHW69_10945 [Rhizomicrobium sp.]|jgi:hypothetical protein|nr:hypothetical protein [Rhizomicrobium sp.]